ncbi:MAG: methyltransferase domain-containing protein [Propionibacterium sp.]
MDDQLPQADRTEEERAYYALQKRVWPFLAPFYEPAVFLPLHKLRRRVARGIHLPPGARLLDVATGTGGQARAFAAKAQEVGCVDLSAAMLRVARRTNRAPNVSFRQADAARLPFADLSFDAACISFALHEMPAGVRDRVLAEMVRVTKPGAWIVVVDYRLPANRLARWLAFHLERAYEGVHYAHFMAADLVALLESAGIHVVEQAPALAGLGRIVIGTRVGHRPGEAGAAGRRNP